MASNDPKNAASAGITGTSGTPVKTPGTPVKTLTSRPGAKTARQSGAFRVADLATRTPTTFDLQPDTRIRTAIARDLDVRDVRKLRFAGQIVPLGKRGWRLTATMGATIVQSCVITLDPVTTRIDEEVQRHYVPAADIDSPEAGSEIEMPQDDTIEALSDTISAFDAMIEALTLALPLYPRADGVELGEAVFAQDGATPLRDDDLKPFAGLAGLRNRLDKND